MNIKDIRDYILEDKLQIRVSLNYVDIVNYKDIGHFDNSKVTIYHNTGVINVIGDNLVISKLMNSEILIIGSIKNIELG